MKSTLARFSLTLLFGIVLAAPLSAQTPLAPAAPAPDAVPERWASQPDNKKKEYLYGIATRARWLAKLPLGATTVLDLPYVDNPVEGTSPGSSQTLDLYVPKGDGPFPLIVWIHGGAWKGGNKNAQGAELAADWLPAGFAVASLEYRFVFDSAFPGMFQDCIDAVAFLRGHAAEYHLDPARIGIMGASAGGHIAGVVALAEGSTGTVYKNVGGPVQGAVLMCGFYDMTRETGPWKPGAMIDNPRDDFTNLYPNRAYDPAIAKAMSPVYLIHPGVPPVLIFHGDKDLNTAPVAQSQLLLDALQKAGKEATLTNFPDYDHNLWKPDALAQALAFFQKNVQGQGK
jgi:acetyl esterase/lipase